MNNLLRRLRPPSGNLRFPNLPRRWRPGPAGRVGGDRFGPRTPPRLRRVRAPSALTLPPLPLRARSTDEPLRARMGSAESRLRPRGSTKTPDSARVPRPWRPAHRNRAAFRRARASPWPRRGATFARLPGAAHGPPKTRPPPPAATSSQSRRPDLAARPDAPRFGPGASRRTLRAALRPAAEPPGLRRITS